MKNELLKQYSITIDFAKLRKLQPREAELRESSSLSEQELCQAYVEGSARRFYAILSNKLNQKLSHKPRSQRETLMMSQMTKKTRKLMNKNQMKDILNSPKKKLAQRKCKHPRAALLLTQTSFYHKENRIAHSHGGTIARREKGDAVLQLSTKGRLGLGL